MTEDEINARCDALEGGAKATATESRIEALLWKYVDIGTDSGFADFGHIMVPLAAEIEEKDRKIAELQADLAEALRIARENAAEVERLKLAADAWELQQEVYAAPDGAEKIAKLMAYGAARDAYNAARAAKKS